MSAAHPINTGAEFADPDVVRANARRTDYPAALHARLLELSAGRGRFDTVSRLAWGRPRAQVRPTP